MNTPQAIEIVERALENPVSTWLEFTPKNVPLVLYDREDFAFLHHPHPSAERPDRLSAATAIEINGVLTAAIPLTLCEDERSLVPLVYHECFHVYQGARFQFKGGHNFFEVLAFYPELNPAYRALCSAEVEIFNNSSLTAHEKAGLLAATALKRRELLAEHAGLVDFEDDLERKEGTASFVEQRAKTLLFGTPPERLACSYSYSRQYSMGAAACRLLEELYPDEKWQKAVESGASLSEILARSAAPATDLSTLELEYREDQEKQEVARVIEKANQDIETLFRNGAITLKLPTQSSVFRSFIPRSIVSLGDGRLLHPEFVRIQTANGTISVENAMTMEDIVQNTVTIPTGSVELKDNRLIIDTENVKVCLENVTQLPNGIIEVCEG